MNARVFVQKNTPKLIGTDVQPRLGFSLNIRREDGKVEDLLGRLDEDRQQAQGAAVTLNHQRDLGEPSSIHQPGAGSAPLQMSDASSPLPLTSLLADPQLTMFVEYVSVVNGVVEELKKQT